MEKEGIFSLQKFEETYHEIKADFTVGKSGVEQPVAIVLGGQPGAGKSNLYTIASVSVIVQHQTFKKIMI